MEKKESLSRVGEAGERRRQQKHDRSPLIYAISGVALVGLAAMLVMALPDIKRYIRISTM